MKWYAIKSLLLLLLTAATYTTQAATPESMEADSLICTQTDDSTTICLPDSVIRKLARSIGMKDSTAVTVDSTRFYPLFYQPERTDGSSAYERRRQRRIEGWARIIPNQAMLHFAGSIGLLSAGLGWHYGRNEHWETELLVGFVPRYHSEVVKVTFTAKQRYVPWHCQLSSRWTLQPLTTGIFFNTISGDDFWKNLPDRYPKKYYGFSTKIRTHVFIGQRLRYNIPHSKRVLHQAVSIYYELSTCDLYIASKVTNRDFPWKETLSLAFGLRWEM